MRFILKNIPVHFDPAFCVRTRGNFLAPEYEPDSAAAALVYFKDMYPRHKL